ncbi:MAG: NAD(P)H-hydrate epimerase [Gammaproteobacteria bacterium]
MILSRDEARELDRRAIQELGIPGVVLMENAGRNIADYLLSLKPTGPVVICCGKGNNAGDGFVIARYLDIHDIPVRIILLGQSEEFKGDAQINYQILTKSGIPTRICHDSQCLEEELVNADWIVDAIFGTGLSGEIRSPYYQMIQVINIQTAKILSIDIPSGLDCDTGKPFGIAIKAQHTATIVALKKGFNNPEAQPYLGKVTIVDIGIPKILLNQ